MTGRPRITPAYSYYALALLTLINVVNYLERNAIFALFEPIKRDLNLTDAHLGWLGSAYVLVFSLAALPVGVLSDIRSRTAVTVVRGRDLERVHQPGRAGPRIHDAPGVAGQWWASAAPRPTPPAPPSSPTTSPGQAGAVAMSIFTAGLALGGVTGILVAGQLEALYGWRVAFMALGLPGFALAAPGRPAPRPGQGRRPAADHGPARRIQGATQSSWSHLLPVLVGLGLGGLARPTCWTATTAPTPRWTRRSPSAPPAGLVVNIVQLVRRTRAETAERRGDRHAGRVRGPDHRVPHRPPHPDAGVRLRRAGRRSRSG